MIRTIFGFGFPEMREAASYHCTNQDHCPMKSKNEITNRMEVKGEVFIGKKRKKKVPSSEQGSQAMRC